MASKKVSFAVMTAAEYRSLSPIVETTLYFISDEQRIYKGATAYSNPFYIFPTLPDTSLGVEKGVYIQTSDNTLHLFSDGAFIPLTGAQQGSELTVENKGNELGSFSTINFNSDLFDVAYDEQTKKATIGSSLKFDTLMPRKFNVSTGSGTTSPIPSVGTTASTRYVSLPSSDTAPYYMGDWSSVASRSVVLTGSTMTINCNTQFWITSSTSTFKIYLVQGTTETEIASFDVSSGTTTYGGGDSDKAKIVFSEFAEGLLGYTAKATFTVYLNKALPSGGRFAIKITHSDVDSAVNAGYKTSDYFYDANPTAPSIGSIGITLNETSSKYLSGVKYVTNGYITADVTGITNLFNQTFPSTAMTINLSNFGMGSKTVASTAVTGYSTTVKDNASASYNSGTSYAINKNGNSNVLTFRTGSATATATLTDGGSATSEALSYSIDTRSSTASDVYEDFVTETYRKKLDLTAWDSETTLVSGNLKVSGDNNQTYGKLAVGVSGETTGKYIRCFRKANVVKDAGTLTLTGTNLTLSSVKVEVSTDGVKWFDMSKDHDGGYLTTDGAGCKTGTSLTASNQTSATIDFSLKGSVTSASTGDANGWGAYFRITLTGASTMLKSLEINW